MFFLPLIPGDVGLGDGSGSSGKQLPRRGEMSRSLLGEGPVKEKVERAGGRKS